MCGRGAVSDDGAIADPRIAHAKVQTLAAAKRRATPALLIDMIASIHGDVSSRSKH
jgi:hypothetical protein